MWKIYDAEEFKKLAPDGIVTVSWKKGELVEEAKSSPPLPVNEIFNLSSRPFSLVFLSTSLIIEDGFPKWFLEG